MRWRYIAIQIIRTNAYSIIKYVFACRGVIDCHFSKINRSLLSWIHTNRIYYYLVSIANSTPTNFINCQSTFRTSKNRQLHFSIQNIYKTSYRLFFSSFVLTTKIAAFQVNLLRNDDSFFSPLFCLFCSCYWADRSTHTWFFE